MSRQMSRSLMHILSEAVWVRLRLLRVHDLESCSFLLHPFPAHSQAAVPTARSRVLIGALCLLFFFLDSSQAVLRPHPPAAANEETSVLVEGRGGREKPDFVTYAMPNRCSESAELNLAGKKTTGKLAAFGR
jgi:hypothetical protein